MIKSLKKKVFNAIGSDNIRLIKSYFPSKEEKELIKKRRVFYMQFLNKGDLYFDVGANYGNRIQPLIGQDIEIVAVEPQIECVNYLSKKYGGKIEIVAKGLGQAEEDKTMHISNAHTVSSFSEEWIRATKESGRFSEYNWEKTQKVKMTTLDNLIGEFGKPKFIKIDVEGYELEVLKGLNKPVEFISFEYTVPEQIDRTIDCLNRIEEISQGEVRCNYSTGESMSWASEEWLTLEKMVLLVKSEQFILTGFGDIYVNNSK